MPIKDVVIILGLRVQRKKITARILFLYSISLFLTVVLVMFMRVQVYKIFYKLRQLCLYS
jgi:hypothetical protein